MHFTLESAMFKKLLLATSLACALSACTIEQQGAETVSEFHMPFSYAGWESRQVTNDHGETACVVTSGHNGLAFVVQKAAGKNVVSVQSNRPMMPGTWMTVTVNGNRYETSNPYFSAHDAFVMSEDFRSVDTAYAEWSTIKGINGRTRFGDVFRLNGFKSAFEGCLK